MVLCQIVKEVAFLSGDSFSLPNLFSLLFWDKENKSVSSHGCGWVWLLQWWWFGRSHPPDPACSTGSFCVCFLTVLGEISVCG